MSGEGLDALEERLAEVADALEIALDRMIPLPLGREARVVEAMRYSVLGGGKRIRAFLVLTAAEMLGVAQESALRVACAVEMVHGYSLVHDDLPAMDDAELRRGRPSTHCQFDQATAILAGDGLLTLAFEMLADPGTHGDAEVRAELVTALARAAGAGGMVGGQMIDLTAEHGSLDIGAITRLQRMKTGEIIAFSCSAGAILGKAPAWARHALQGYAHDLGLAFQIADDLLDAEGSIESVGKPVGRDSAAGKATFVSILGLERAREQAELLAEQAGRHLDLFEEKADLLKDMARFVVARRR